MKKEKINLIQPPLSPLSGGRIISPPMIRGGLGKGCLKIGLILLLVFVGLFGSAGRARAADPTLGTCVSTYPAALGVPSRKVTQEQNHASDCPAESSDGNGGIIKSTFTLYSASHPNPTPDSTKITTEIAPTNPPAQPTDFENAMASRSCVSWGGADIPWCLVVVSNLVFHTVPAFFLAKTAFFFNVLISVTLNGDVFKQDFVPKAWGIVRDLSNIFFILILLYIAIKLILGLGGSDVKKMIRNVVILALLINFSMFFTQVIIDTSNIVALIFYNKLNVTTKNPDGTIRDYSSINGEKDVAGGMVAAFDPTIPLKKEFFDASAIQYYTDQKTGKTAAIPGTEVPAGTMIAIILITGLIMGFAIYALFISGLSFLGRLLELWVLIIFSPFAFMSSTVPKLAGIEDLGWDAWLKRLLTVAFMAPIFMFFLYFIFMLIGSNIFTQIIKSGPSTIVGAYNDPAGATKMLLGVVMPAIFICILLIKATKYAKKGSGQFGEAITKFGGKIGGLAVGLAGGAALGGLAFAGRTAIGGGGGFVANKMASGANMLGAKLGDKWGNRLGVNKLASGLTRVGAAAQKSSFDVRGVPGVSKLLGAAGLAAGAGLIGVNKGGIAQTRKEKVEKRMKRADELKVREDEGLKQKLNKTQGDLQGLLGDNAQEIETVDKLIEKKRLDAQDAKRQFDAGTLSATALAGAEDDLKDAKNRKTALVTGKDYTNLSGTTFSYSKTATTASGGTIDSLEKQKKTDEQAIKTENARRQRAYANRISKPNRLIQAATFIPGLILGAASPGLKITSAANMEAASNIRAGTKLDSGTKTT